MQWSSFIYTLTRFFYTQIFVKQVKMGSKCNVTNDASFRMQDLYVKTHYIFVSFVFVIKRILTGKKHRQIKLQRLQKVGILTFGSLVHQINSL